ncbi:hypothetical protein IMG5_158680, partial [Ichthyophthirius multifiliis]
MLRRIVFFFAKKKKTIIELQEQHPDKEYFKKQLEIAQKNEEIESIKLNLKDIVIPIDQLETRFSRSQGAGGQHLNKTNSKAEIRFNIGNAKWFINEDIKNKFRKQYKQYITQDDQFVITSQIGRSQDQNLKDAVKKLQDM